MLPSVSPVRASMSTGVTTSRCSTRSPKPGKCDSRTACALSPKLSRSVSQSLPAQLVRRVLHEARHDVLAGRRHVGVDDRLDGGVDERLLGVPAVLRGVEGALDVLDGRADVEEAAVVVDGVGQRREDRQPVEGEVDLGRDAAELHPAHVVDQVERQLARLDELEEGTPRVERRDHDRRPELGAVLEHDADRPAARR